MYMGTVPPQDMPKRCFEHLVAAARLNGNAMDAFAVAVFYRDGLATDIDLVEAERWFEEAARRGGRNAMRELQNLRRKR
jgi:TPR repeat protein